MVKLSKALLLSVLVVSLVASASFATTSRVQALQAANYINDDSDIFRWYGTLPSYTNMVMVEFGQAMGSTGPGGLGSVTPSYQAIGFTHNWGEDHWLGTWGVFLLNNHVGDGSFFLNNPRGTPDMSSLFFSDVISMTTTKFVFSWGNELEMFSYGLNFTRSDTSVELPGGDQEDINFTTVGGGVRLDIGEDAYGDVALTFGFAGGDTLGGFENGSAIDLAARLFWEFTDDATLVPFVEWSTYDYALDDPSPSTGSKVNDFKLGASLNFDVNTSNMLIFATELEFFGWEPSNVATGDQEKLDITHLPKFILGLESDITSWLTTRIGATKTMAKYEYTDAAGDEWVWTGPNGDLPAPYDTAFPEGSDFSWYLGAGFHLGEWDLDAVVEPDVPFRMGYWLTGYGAGDADPPVARLSGTYRF
jgi:hypothetical protein